MTHFVTKFHAAGCLYDKPRTRDASETGLNGVNQCDFTRVACCRPRGEDRLANPLQTRGKLARKRDGVAE